MKFPKIFNYSLWILLTASILSSCESPLEAPTPVSGDADFSTYVALGDSFAAGVQHSGVFREAQEESYPNQIAMSMQSVGGAVGFKQPLMPEGPGTGYLTLDALVPGPALGNEPGDPTAFASVAGDGPYQNLGIPAARSFDLVTSSLNPGAAPFYSRFATSFGSSTPVGDAAAQAPSFVSIWIGGNDVLGFSSNGGEGDVITPQADFDNSLDAVFASLNAANPNVKGVIGNIPDILAAPYFTTVAWNAFDIPQEIADATNAGIRAQAEPQVRLAVEAGARDQAQAGVEAQALADIRAGVEAQVEADARAGVEAQIIATQVRPGVEAAVRQQLIQGALAQGLTQEQAEAFADDAIANDPATQATIEEQVALAADSVLSVPEVQAQVDAAVDSIFSLASTQAGIDAAVDSVFNDPTTQAGIDAAVDSVFNDPTTQATIDATVDATLEAVLAPVTVQAGPNGFLVFTDDPAFPLGIRKAQEGDLITLPALAYTGSAEFGALPVLPANMYLDRSEQAQVTTAISGYNAKINAIAEANGWAVADVDGLFESVKSGLYYNGLTYTTGFITGNTFSLDGIHLTDRAYSLFANTFIDAINEKFGATLPIREPNIYKGIEFP
ncbi:MAG: SGNH/GDSL hydrolase family protein [Bacteroidota bacterium]